LKIDFGDEELGTFEVVMTDKDSNILVKRVPTVRSPNEKALINRRLFPGQEDIGVGGQTYR
jgi:hypothetical protein